MTATTRTVVEFEDFDSADIALTGGKAVALAIASSVGLPTSGGVVLATVLSDAVSVKQGNTHDRN